MKYRCLQDKAAIQVNRLPSVVGRSEQLDNRRSHQTFYDMEKHLFTLDASRVLHNRLLFITFLCIAVTDYEYDVQCEQLTPPNHGHINASDSNNLYSKVTYSCDPGYKVEG